MNLSTLSKKKKIGLLILVGSFMLGFLMFNMYQDFFASDTKAVTAEATSSLTIPDAELREVNSSKLETYQNKTSAEKLWSEAAEDLYSDEEVKSSESSSASFGDFDSSESYVTTEDLIADITGEPKESKSTSRTKSSTSTPVTASQPTSKQQVSEPKPGSPGYKEYKMQKYRKQKEEAIAQAMAQAQVSSNPSETPAPEDTTEPDTEKPEDNVSLGTKAVIRKTSAMSSLDDDWGSDDSGFSSLTDGSDAVPTDEEYPFECMFVRAEKLTNGSRVAVRLLEDMVIGGVLIPRNTHLQAMCNIDTRLQLRIASIELNSRIFSLGYEAYDSDGYKGIYCPDLGTQERQQVKSRGLNLFSSLIGSRVGRAVNDVVQTGVSIAENRNGQVTVAVPAGYKFFIVKQKNY